MNENLVVSVSPHIRSGDTITAVMLDVIAALLPLLALSLYFYPQRAPLLILSCVLGSCLTEYVSQRMLGRKARLSDLSAVVTGLILALCLPLSLSPWMAAAGGAFSIFAGKQVFGGIGNNPFNPALIGRTFLQAAWPEKMHSWINPADWSAALAPAGAQLHRVSFWKGLFLGSNAGCMGETARLLLVIGGLYLLFRKRIKPHIPLGFAAAVAGISLFAGVDPLMNLFTGGLLLGAFFMATDPVTSPVSPKGKVLFGIGCGLFTMFIRLRGGFAEGVFYSIIAMNMFVPLIDRFTLIKRFGT
jgi:Na+-translocating ferredoxin:NAD+ oxidoreductase subunit D